MNNIWYIRYIWCWLMVVAVVRGEEFPQTSNLDSIRGGFAMLRRMAFGMADNNNIYRSNAKNGKTQHKIPKWVPFPCNTTNGRSPTPPSSIHQLRPGDIDIIAAIGDSLSAGNGGISESLMHVANEYRAISFSGGGKGDWRKFLTLPNILKEFNPDLYGYSVEDGMTTHKGSRLNIAEPMVMSRDMLYQAKTLVRRMKSDHRVNMTHHWKLLTIFVGNNDVCSDMCHHTRIEEFVENHERDLLTTLRFLRNNLPRLLVNIVSIPNMRELHNMPGPTLDCYVAHYVGCHCIFSYDATPAKLERLGRVMADWQSREKAVCDLEEFDTDDFAAVLQPFMITTKLPAHRDGSTDLRYFAADCFHFSQRGHALMANILWNNMMQPEGKKQQHMTSTEFDEFECPTDQRPFIATKRNSVDLALNNEENKNQPKNYH